MPTQALTADDRLEIIDFIQRFYRLVDTGRAGETSAMFSNSALLHFGEGSPKPGTLRGAEIAAAMHARGQLTGTTTRHALSNFSLALGADIEISMQYLMTLFRSDGGPLTSVPAFVADVEDVLVQEAAGWCIIRRTVSPVFFRT